MEGHLSALRLLLRLMMAQQHGLMEATAVLLAAVRASGGGPWEARLEAPASNIDFISIDKEMEALGEDHPEVDVMPGRMSRQEDHTFYPPIQPQPDVLNRSSETLKETPRVHKERIQKPADPLKTGLCPICGKPYSIKLLKRHIREVHTGPGPGCSQVPPDGPRARLTPD